MRKPFKKHLEDISVEQAHGGSGSRQLLLSKNDQISSQLEAMTKGYLESGSSFDWHKHDNIDEFFFILKGTGVIEYEDGTKLEYQPDDLIYSPSNLNHKVTNTGQDTNEFLFIRLKH